MMSRLDFITNDKKSIIIKKKKEWSGKTKKQLLKELENAHFTIAKLEICNLKSKKEISLLNDRLEELVNEKERHE